ncbi:MAG: hypothetical protein DHS80DRAFT_7716, partial [Piptocephalis tieghemiana]
MALSNRDIIDCVIAFFVPPLAVFLKRGCGADFVINILLTILGIVPGMIHAFYIIFKY